MDQATRLYQKRKRRNRFFQGLFFAATFFGLFFLAVLLITVAADGLVHVDWQFLTSFASRHVEQAGIYAALVGTLWVIGLTIPLILIIGVTTAIYLEEYQERTRWSQWIQTNIYNLAGVPSILYGILGLAVFVRFFEFGFVVVSAVLTMTLLVLPIVIVASQEALRTVPVSLRAASYALGATRWQTVSRVVLPSAIPGILTGVILAVSRAIGETAPLIMVGAVTYVRFVPQGIFDRYTVLPIQIYSWTTLPQEEFHSLAAGAIIVLLTLLLLLNAAAIFIRNRFQQQS